MKRQLNTIIFFMCIVLLLTSCRGAGSNDTAKEPHDSATNLVRPILPDNDTVKAYSTAIAEYIKLVYKNGEPLPDTMFVGRNIEFPEIVLPPVIAGANIMVLTSEEAEEKLRYRKSLVYLNVVGWMDKDPQFIIVTFFEFKPQYNLALFLKRDSASSQFVVDSLHFEYPYGKLERSH